MKKDLIEYPVAKVCDSYAQVQERICEETYIINGVIVYKEILFMDDKNHPELRRVIVEGFRKTFFLHGTMVRIPSDSERERITPTLLERLNANPSLPPVERILYAHRASN